jgi:hypothetical protein
MFGMGFQGKKRNTLVVNTAFEASKIKHQHLEKLKRKAKYKSRRPKDPN